MAVLAACGGPADGVETLRIDGGRTAWSSQGFWRLEPPVHMPSPQPGVDQVEVWLALGELPVGVTVGDDGLARLQWPTGTRADRLEFDGEGAARRIVDVRGTSLGDDGCWHHVLRPQTEAPGAALVGVRWRCDDPEAARVATAQMLAQLATLPPFSTMPSARRERALAAFEQRNDCDGCHAEARPDAARLGAWGPVARGTDASGFFAPQSLLRDEQPLEAYGAHDANVDDPAIAVDCAGVPAQPRDVTHGARRYQCDDGVVPHARVDWAALWRDDPVRARSICDGRARLVAAMDDSARAHFAGSLEPCTR
ncbi:MAG: hypothetical protein K1X88_23690 [Nannocystaceae bacterium]|nr:hypothetical protein [Nannocystaceae bacterium]